MGLFLIVLYFAFASYSSNESVITLTIAYIEAAAADETILINNASDESFIDLTGWSILAGRSTPRKERYQFPDDCILPPESEIYIHSGPNNLGKISDPCDATQKPFSSLNLIWKPAATLPNDNLSVELYDANANLVYAFPFTISPGQTISSFLPSNKEIRYRIIGIQKPTEFSIRLYAPALGSVLWLSVLSNEGYLGRTLTSASDYHPTAELQEILPPGSEIRIGAEKYGSAYTLSISTQK